MAPGVGPLRRIKWGQTELSFPYDGAAARAAYEVVPGSGTGELAGLSGTGGFSAGHAEEHDMTLDYEL